MAHTCEDCGADLDGERDTNSAGHYRDRCLPCIRESVRASHVPHVETCTEPDCLVCTDYAEEFAHRNNY